MALEITVLQGVDVFAQMFNAVAAFVRNETWHSLMVIAEIIGVIACMIVYIKKRDLKVMGLWLLSFVLINTLLLTPKERLVIQELQTSKIRTVDNVPLGVALPMYFTTLVGNAIARSYDTLLAQPEDLQYSRTGLLFGQRMMDHSFDITSNHSYITSNINNYMKFCLIERNIISKEFAWTTLFNSSTLKEYFDKGKAGDFMNYTASDGKVDHKDCEASGKQIQKDITDSLRADRKGPAWEFARKIGIDKLLEGKSIPEVNSKLAAVQNYFMGTSQAAADIYVQNILVNQYRRAIDSYPVQLDASAVLIDQTAAQSLTKMKLSHLSSYQVSGRLLPALHTTLLALMVGLFPVMVLAMFVRELAWGVVKNYLAVLFSLMMWPVMFAIFNSIMNTLLYQTLNGQSFTLSNANTLKENASTMAGVAMWLTASIPFLSFRLVTSLGQSIASAGSYLGNAMVGATTADAAQTAQGNYNWGNMSTNNVNGNKVDLNHVSRIGMSTTQLENGASVSTTADGRTITDVTGAVSKLPVNINWASSMSETFTTSAAVEQRKSQELLQGSRNSLQQATNIAQGLNHTHSDVSQSGSNTMISNGVGDSTRFGNTDNVQKGTGTKNVNTHNVDTQNSENTNTHLSGKVGANVGLGVPIFGGVSASGEFGKGKNWAKNDMEIASQQKVADDISNALKTYDKTRNIDNFNSVVTQVSSGNLTSDQLNKINSITHHVNNSHEQFTQATTSAQKAKVLSEQAQMAQTQSVQFNANMDSYFEQYLRSKYSSDEVNTMLSPVATSDMRSKMLDESQKFMAEFKETIKSSYTANTARLENQYDGIYIHNGGVAKPNGVGLDNKGQASVLSAVSRNPQSSDNGSNALAAAQAKVKGAEKEFIQQQILHDVNFAMQQMNIMGAKSKMRDKQNYQPTKDDIKNNLIPHEH